MPDATNSVVSRGLAAIVACVSALAAQGEPELRVGTLDPDSLVLDGRLDEAQ